MPTYQYLMALRNKAILEHYPRCKWVTESCCYDLSLSLGRCFQINSSLLDGITHAGFPETAEGCRLLGPCLCSGEWQTPKWPSRASSLTLQGRPTVLTRHNAFSSRVCFLCLLSSDEKAGHADTSDKESPHRKPSAVWKIQIHRNQSNKILTTKYSKRS